MNQPERRASPATLRSVRPDRGGVVISRREAALSKLPESLRSHLRRYRPDECRLVHELLGDEDTGRVMIDVGACEGSALSHFARDGWTVYAFEPDAANRSTLEAAWGDVPGITIDPRAVSNDVTTGVPFFRSDVSIGISGLAAFHESHEPAGTVNTTTIEEFTIEHGIDHIDFLKIDTEGHDLFVLEGIDWDRMQPTVVVAEFEDAKTVPLGYRFDDIAGFLAERGYAVIVSEWFPVVEYGQQHKWRRLATYPTILEDPDGWGNLIAVSDPLIAARLQSVLASTARRWRLDGWLRQLAGA